MKIARKIDVNDNVAVAIKNLSAHEVIIVDNRKIELKENIKRGHKIALKNIEKGKNVIKYGYPIGHAIENIESGAWVHAHNLKTNLSGINEYTFKQNINKTYFEDEHKSFKGYLRADGEAGIRNELWIVPTVGCVNGIADAIINKFKRRADIKKVDSIDVFKHNYGCSQLGNDHENTKMILGNIIKHPNAGGVLILGLGCENNSMPAFKESLGSYDKNRVRFLVAQEVNDEIEEGVDLLKELYQNMLHDARVEIPLSKLRIGLKCGGSDGFSGITANPLLGAFSDYLISQGGTAVLTEVPEMFGAETILMNRCRNKEVFNKTVSLINDFKNYFMSYNQVVYENPSPGNKEGGISTLEDKSLGCIQKGGNAPIVDVLKYGELLKKSGLNLLSAPGNDLVSSTALGASGCQLILFTTGRGTPFGCFVPTMKVSTNSQIYDLKRHWIDFNAGVLLEDRPEKIVLNKLIKRIIKVASGQLVNNEKNGIREIAIFKSGVTL